MTTQEWQTIVALIIGVASIAGIIFGIIRFYIRVFARQELEEQLKDIRHELKPNSGQSIKDQVTRLEAGHADIKKENDQINKKLDKLEEKIDKVFDIIIDKLGH